MVVARLRKNALMRLGGGAPGLGDLFSIVRELSFDDLRDEAQLPPRLLLVGTDRESLVPLREVLGGNAAEGFIDTAAFDDLPAYLDAYDGIVLVNAAPAERNRPAIRAVLENAETAGRTLTFQLPPGSGTNGFAELSPLAVDDLRSRLVTRLSHRQLALGRYLPAFRKQAAQGVIGQTARANAEFALLSNIPAVIPVVGNIMAIGADFLVLTKNQLMLIYKLAAIHGRDLGQPWRIYGEMLPVVGVGILWRTVARELAGLIPFAAGTIPKILVAYVGTAVAGQTANLYYEHGERPTGEQLRKFYERATAIARALPLGRRGSKVIEGQFTVKPPTAAEATPPPNGASTAGIPPTDRGARELTP